MLYLWLGARRPTAPSYDSSSVSRYYLGWPLHLLRGNSASKNLPCKAQRPKCRLYKTPYYLAAPVRETGEVIAHLQEPDFFLVHEHHGSQETHLVIILATTSCVYKEATCKSSTIKGLLYAHETLIVAWRYDDPRDWLWDACHMAGVRWGSRCKGFCSKEGPHYCFEQSARNPTIDLIHEWKSLGDSIPELYCVALQGLCHPRKCQFEDFWE